MEYDSTKPVKTCLRKILGKAYLGYEELQTLITEVEAVVNSRPLTYLHSDSQELSPLTPAHFLVGQRITTLPTSQPIPTSNARKVDGEQLTKRWNYRWRLMNQFWNRWKNEYLMELRSAHYVNPVSKVTPFKVGDVVFIHEDKLPRHVWKMGRVEEVFIGRDGKIRSCSIKLPSNSVIKRPIQLLHRLEMDE